MHLADNLVLLAVDLFTCTRLCAGLAHTLPPWRGDALVGHSVLLVRVAYQHRRGLEIVLPPSLGNLNNAGTVTAPNVKTWSQL